MFGSLAHVVENLVWLPTWHQARMLCQQLGTTDDELANDWQSITAFSPGEDLVQLYRRIGEALQEQRARRQQRGLQV